MVKEKNSDQYSDEEAQRRFEAALRGAREVGHEPMKDISPKRFKPRPYQPSQAKNKSEKPAK